MFSKGLQRPLEPDSVPDVPPVSDSDDDLSSPECLLSLQPVEDDYSSDDEARKKEKMLTATSINASDVRLWEMEFLGLTYKSYLSKKEMQGISGKDLFTESLKFYFPESLPESYKDCFNLKPADNWETIGSVLFQSFMDETDNAWLEKNYPTDFSKVTEVTEEYVNKKAMELWSFWVKDKTFKCTNRKAFHMANEFNKVLSYLYEDHVSKCDKKDECADDDDCDENEKHDKIVGLLNEIVSYLEIPKLYSGAGRVDFKHSIKGRKSSLAFKVKPDLTLCSCTGDVVIGTEKTPSEPFAVVEVYGESATLTPQKSRKASTKSSLSDESTDQALADEVKLMIIDSDFSSIYNDDSVRKNIRKHITTCGPPQCGKGDAANKLYAQLALQMYGALIQKAKSISKVQVHSSFHKPKANLQIAGFFVENELIYLAKMNQMLRSLGRDEVEHVKRKKAHEPKVTYAKNLYFNLNLSNHRLAFMALLYHYYRIHDLEEMAAWEHIVAKVAPNPDANDTVNVCSLMYDSAGSIQSKEMFSKGLKRPLELDSVPDVQPVSNRDDDMSSPECLLSLQPVEDDYSSDDEARKKLTRSCRRVKKNCSESATNDFPDIARPDLSLYKTNNGSSFRAEQTFSYEGIRFQEIGEEIALEDKSLDECLGHLFKFSSCEFYDEEKREWKGEKVTDLTEHELNNYPAFKWLSENDNIDWKTAGQEEALKHEQLKFATAKLYNEGNHHFTCAVEKTKELYEELCSHREDQSFRHTKIKACIDGLAFLISSQDYLQYGYCSQDFDLHVPHDVASDKSPLIPEGREVVIINKPAGIFTQRYWRNERTLDKLWLIAVEVYGHSSDKDVEQHRLSPAEVSPQNRVLPLFKPQNGSGIEASSQRNSVPPKTSTDSLLNPECVRDIRKHIAGRLPVQCGSDHCLDKMAGEHVQQLLCVAKQATLYDLGRVGVINALGLFVVNEYVYFSRLDIQKEYLTFLSGDPFKGRSLGIFTVSNITETYRELDSPTVSYSNFRLDLTVAKHRQVLLIFLKNYVGAFNEF